MSTRTKCRAAVGLLVAAFLAVGCNPLTMPFFMMFGIDDKVPPEFKLSSATGKEVKVVLLPYASPDAASELLGVDKQIAKRVSAGMALAFQQAKEKVLVVEQHKVDRFMNDHPDWRTMKADEIAKFFGADLVIDMEVMRVSLYEPGSRRTLYKGHSTVMVSVRDVRKLSEGTVWSKEIDLEYPRSRYIAASEKSPDGFRDLFVQRIATEVVRQFAAHSSSDTYFDRTD